MNRGKEIQPRCVLAGKLLEWTKLFGRKDKIKQGMSSIKTRMKNAVSHSTVPPSAKKTSKSYLEVRKARESDKASLEALFEDMTKEGVTNNAT